MVVVDNGLRSCVYLLGICIQSDFNKLVAEFEAEFKFLTPFQRVLVWQSVTGGVDVDLFKSLSDLPTRNGCIGDAVGSAGLVERYPNNNPNPPRMSVISKFLEPIFYQKLVLRQSEQGRLYRFVLFAEFAVIFAEPTKNIVIPFQYGRRESLVGPTNNPYVDEIRAVKM